MENERASFKFEVATAKTHTPVSNRAYDWKMVVVVVVEVGGEGGGANISIKWLLFTPSVGVLCLSCCRVSLQFFNHFLPSARR